MRDMAPSGYSPTMQIQSRFTDPRLQDVFLSIRELVTSTKLDPLKLTNGLQELRPEIDNLAQVISQEYFWGDSRLEKFTEVLFRGLEKEGYAQKGFKRKFLVQQACSKGFPEEDLILSGDRDLGDETNPCSFYQKDLIDCDVYMLDSEFGTSKEYNSVRIHDCKNCGSDVRLLSTANVLVASSSPIINSIVSRVKGDGGKYSKLVEVLCHGISENKRLRNIDDFYALSILTNNFASPFDVRQVKKFISDYFDPKTLQHSGIKIPSSKLPVDKRLQYAILCYASTKLDDRSILPHAMDDHVQNPLMMGGSRKEPWTGMRFAGSFKALDLELHIKSKNIYDCEYNPESELFHPSYSVRRADDRKKEWTTAHKEIYSALTTILRKNPTPLP